MPSIYSSQAIVSGNALEPVASFNGYVPIPLIEPLSITDNYLQFGGTAFLTLFLGYVSSNGVAGFHFYVSIIDTSGAGNWVTEVYLGGANSVATAVSISAAYNILPNTNPNFLAQWQLEGNSGVGIQPPSQISFSAIVFETMG
jgi:hypothetical protein